MGGEETEETVEEAEEVEDKGAENTDADASDEDVTNQAQGEQDEQDEEEAPIEVPDKHQVGPYKIGLKAPASYIVCREIVKAASVNEERAYYAALGACWRGKGKPKVRYNYDPLKYGGLVFDDLAARGIGPKETALTAFWAMLLLSRQARAMPTRAEVDEAAGFSDAEDS